MCKKSPESSRIGLIEKAVLPFRACCFGSVVLFLTISPTLLLSGAAEERRGAVNRAYWAIRQRKLGLGRGAVVLDGHKDWIGLDWTIK